MSLERVKSPFIFYPTVGNIYYHKKTLLWYLCLSKAFSAFFSLDLFSIIFDSFIQGTFVKKGSTSNNTNRYSFSNTSDAEAVVLRCPVKKVFLKISQNSQENTCARVSLLIKLQASGLVFSCEFCEIFKNIVFYRTPPATGCKDAMDLILLVVPESSMM